MSVRMPSYLNWVAEYNYSCKRRPEARGAALIMPIRHYPFEDEHYGENIMWQDHGIRVFVIERDIYARQSISSYLSWDRRTRVVGVGGTPHEMIALQATHPECGRLDAITLDTGLANDPESLTSL